MADQSTWAELVELAQELKAEDLVPSLAHMRTAYAIDAANSRQRADDPGIREIRVYPLGLTPKETLRAEIAEAMLIEIRYMMQRGLISTRDIASAVPDDQLLGLARVAVSQQAEREFKAFTSTMTVDQIREHVENLAGRRV